MRIRVHTRIAAILVCLLLALTLAGCVHANRTITFNSDGTGTYTYTIGFSAQMISLGGAVAFGLVDLGKKKVDLPFQRVIALVGGELAVLFRRVELVEMKVGEAVVVESRWRFGGVRVDHVIGEVGHLIPLILFGGNVGEAKVSGKIFGIGFAALSAGLLSVGEFAGVFLRLTEDDPGFGEGGIGLYGEVEVLERFVGGVLAGGGAAFIEFLASFLRNFVVVVLRRRSYDGVHGPVKAGWRTGKGVGVIAIKFGFLPSGMTNVRVNAHSVAVLGEQGRAEECE